MIGNSTLNFEKGMQYFVAHVWCWTN